MIEVVALSKDGITALTDAENVTMPKKIDLSREEVAEWLSYDPNTGIFRWLKSNSRRIHPGDQAGSLKRTLVTTGNKRPYRYITLHGVSTPAARFAWLLHYGEWPSAPVICIDDNSDNLRIANLKLARFPTRKEMKDGRRVYRMSKDAQRHYGLKRYYGLTGEEYGRMLAEQKGVCAICQQPETAMFNGVPKVLHVDHCHKTDRIRALLCGTCNAMLGHAKEDPAILRAAADYLEKHRAKIVEIGAAPAKGSA